jgi:hypothetical protein
MEDMESVGGSDISMSFSALLVVGVAVADPKNDIMTSDDEEGFRTKSTGRQPCWAQIGSLLVPRSTRQFE